MDDIKAPLQPNARPGEAIRRLIRQILPIVARVGIDPEDDDEMRLRKSSLVLGSAMVIMAGILWGLLYFLFDERLAAAIPLCYSILSFLSIMVFHITRRYDWFRFTQLLLILLLPFLLMIALGGFVGSSAVILWSLICPLAAFLFAEPRHAVYWLLAYLGLLAISGFLEFRPLMTSSLSPTVVTAFFVLNIGTVSTIVIALLAYFVSRKNWLFELLQNEQAKSESLLLNILPKDIAAILKNDSRTIADHYESASVMFADMVGFTPLSAELGPVDIVELLNEAFSYFDSLLDTYQVEKIRTIGDNYMVASGVPGRRADHAQALVAMALEMQDYVARHSFRGGRHVDFRIGINSGSVIAGVIGRRKFVYDVWGDAVNVASRMESHGLVGFIQITQATYELIKDEFVCEPRGTVEVKGKGQMDVWLVLGAKEIS